MGLEHLTDKFENTKDINGNNNENNGSSENNDKMDEILKLGEDTSNITTPSIDTLFAKKKKKRATNIYLSEDVYNKVVTLAMESGESLTSVMEKIISATVQDVKIKQHLVREYNNKMEKKRQPKNINKQSIEE